MKDYNPSDLEQLVEAPLREVEKAQTMMAHSPRSAAQKPEAATGELPRPSLIGIPTLGVDQVDITFSSEVPGQTE